MRAARRLDSLGGRVVAAARDADALERLRSLSARAALSRPALASGPKVDSRVNPARALPSLRRTNPCPKP